MTTATRAVTFSPLHLGGAGAPAVATGYYVITPTAAYDDGAGRVELIPFQVPVNGAAVTVDLPVTGPDWALKVVGTFPTITGTPLQTTEYVVVLAGTGTLQFENLPRVDPATLTTEIAPPDPAWWAEVSGLSTSVTGLGMSLAADLALKAPLASPTFTGTVAGVTATMVGLGSVNNTSDAGKPVSTAQQSALDLKAPIATPTLTGTVTVTHPTTTTTELVTISNLGTAPVIKAVSSTTVDLWKTGTVTQTINGVAGVVVSWSWRLTVDRVLDARFYFVCGSAPSSGNITLTYPAGFPTVDQGPSTTRGGYGICMGSAGVSPKAMVVRFDSTNAYLFDNVANLNYEGSATITVPKP